MQDLADSKVDEASYSLQIEQPRLPSCSYGKNHEILCASDCVELKYKVEIGRYIEATREIRPGTVSLLVDRPCIGYELLKILIKSVNIVISVHFY